MEPDKRIFDLELELRNEVKMLRSIVQSLMYIFTEEQDLESDFEEEVEDKNILFGKQPGRKYVS